MHSFHTKSPRSMLSWFRPSAAPNVAKAEPGNGRLFHAVSVALEPLESRMLLSAVVVNSTSDTATGNGIVTLRDAINDANGSSTPTTITFDPTVFATAQTITLDGTQLALSNTAESTTITGPSAGLTISANGQSRVLSVDAGVTASLSGLTVTDGQATDNSGDGGGILVAGSLTLTNVTVNDSTATGSGGGIYNSGTVSMTGGGLTGNTAADFGGGVDAVGVFSLSNATVSGNTATTSDGGGIEDNGTTVDVADSTFFDNSGEGNGGAVSIYAGTGAFTNVTMSGNIAHIYNGGGIEIYSNASATLNNLTIVDNSAGQWGGGVRVAGSADIGNTIIAGDTATDLGPDVYGDVTSEGNNFIGATDDSSGWINSDFTGTAADPLNPDLGTLANNGGPTETLLPLSGSPVIAAGSVSSIPSGITTDQRGLPRTFQGTVDIGAVEQESSSGALIVTTNPASQTEATGQTVTFTAAATGSPTPTVQWQISTDLGIDYTDIDGATSDTYTFTATPQFTRDEFRAVFTNSEGTAYSTAATLTVTSTAVPLHLHIASVGSLATGKLSPITGDSPLTSTATISNLQDLWLSLAPMESGSASASPTASTFAADGLIAPEGKASYAADFFAVGDGVSVSLSMSAAAGIMNLLDMVLPASAWKPSGKLISELDKIDKTTALFSAKADLIAAAAGRISVTSAADAIASYTSELFAHGDAQWKLVKADLKAAGVALTTAEMTTLESTAKIEKKARTLIGTAHLDTTLVTGSPIAVDFVAGAG